MPPLTPSPTILLGDDRIWINMVEGRQLVVGAWRFIETPVLDDAEAFSFSLRQNLGLSAGQISEAVSHLCNMRGVQSSIINRHQSRALGTYNDLWCELLFPEEMNEDKYIVDYSIEYTAHSVPSSVSEAWDVPMTLVFEDRLPSQLDLELHKRVGDLLGKRSRGSVDQSGMGRKMKKRRIMAESTLKSLCSLI